MEKEKYNLLEALIDKAEELEYYPKNYNMYFHISEIKTTFIIDSVGIDKVKFIIYPHADRDKIKLDDSLSLIVNVNEIKPILKKLYSKYNNEQSHCKTNNKNNIVKLFKQILLGINIDNNAYSHKIKVDENQFFITVFDKKNNVSYYTSIDPNKKYVENLSYALGGLSITINKKNGNDITYIDTFRVLGYELDEYLFLKENLKKKNYCNSISDWVSNINNMTNEGATALKSFVNKHCLEETLDKSDKKEKKLKI